MSDISRHRWRRLWASGSPVLLAGGTAVILALTPFVLQTVATNAGAATSGMTVSISPWIIWFLFGGARVGVILLLIQWRAEYRKRTYDPTWALVFDSRFNTAEMKLVRSKAAKALLNNQGQLQRTDSDLGDIDDILDFFEDLGFYMNGDQITPEVAHHAFHYWIFGYYYAARDYIDSAQEDRPTNWEFVKGLFNITNEVEIERSHGKDRKNFGDEEIEEFLSDEIKLVS